MGNSSYSFESRSLRAASMNYMANTIDQNFTQNAKKVVHQSMDPNGVRLREARDSASHPHTVPIIFALDVTGSMGKIPQYLVQTGLPKIMGGIIQHGIPDPALMFVAVGDAECDRHPLQVGQFESGDEELDMWLTRTYLEGGGGGNLGESYLLAWYFAALHTATDAWDKRHEKGFLFTIGDEPCLPTLQARHINGIMGEGAQATYSDKDLLAMAQEKWNVYHLHMMQGSQGSNSLGYWKQLLGPNCIVIGDQHDVATTLINIITQGASRAQGAPAPQQAPSAPAPDKDDSIIL